jgi:hypothetical protein
MNTLNKEQVALMLTKVTRFAELVKDMTKDEQKGIDIGSVKSESALIYKTYKEGIQFTVHIDGHYDYISISLNLETRKDNQRSEQNTYGTRTTVWERFEIPQSLTLGESRKQESENIAEIHALIKETYDSHYEKY